MVWFLDGQVRATDQHLDRLENQLTPEEKFRSDVERVKVHDIKKIKKGQYNRWKSQFRITKKFRKVNTRRKVSFRGRTRESFLFDLQLQEVNKNYRASREKGDS